MTVSKDTQISDFMKIHTVGAELLHVDMWTDRPDVEANGRFLQCCECA